MLLDSLRTLWCAVTGECCVVRDAAVIYNLSGSGQDESEKIKEG